MKKYCAAIIGIMIVLYLSACSTAQVTKTLTSKNNDDIPLQTLATKEEEHAITTPNLHATTTPDPKTEEKTEGRSLIIETDYAIVSDPFAIEMSYVIDPTFENLYEVADYVLMIKPQYVEQVIVPLKGYPFPKTQVRCDVLESFKGELNENQLSIAFDGGTISLKQYQNLYGLKDGDMKVLEGKSHEELEQIHIPIYPADFVDITAGQSYLLFLTNSGESGLPQQICSGYAVYESVDSESFYNPLWERTVNLGELNHLKDSYFPRN